jgi:hypothetical protein
MEWEKSYVEKVLQPWKLKTLMETKFASRFFYFSKVCDLH